MSLVSVHRNQMFPREFLEHLVNHFNRVINHPLLTLSANQLEIRFKRSPYCDKSVVISLFTKLVTAFKSISERYIIKQEDFSKLKLRTEDTDEFYKIIITGTSYVPPGKILNLFSLILWYHIRFTTGTNPSGTEDGMLLNDKWKREEKNLRFEINRSKRRVGMAREEGPCYLCGEMTLKTNNWEFRPHRNSRGIEMVTMVCNKHVNKLI